jgi:hypothetical protein
MPVWHVLGTVFSEASNASSVMEETSFKCKFEFQGFSSELVNNNDIIAGKILKGFGNVEDENPVEQVLRDVWLPVRD